MSILEELLELSSQEDRVNKAIEYVQSGYPITSNELILIDSEKDRTKILSLYMLNDGNLDNRILKGIDDEQNREKIILAWLKNQGEVRKKVKYNQELGYIMKYGLVYLDVITMQKTQESITKIISAMIDNNIYTTEGNAMLRRYIPYLDLIEDEKVKEELQQQLEAKFRNMCIINIENNMMGSISEDVAKLLTNDEYKRDIVNALGKAKKEVPEYLILSIKDLDTREIAIRDLIFEGKGITAPILRAARKENRVKILDLQAQYHKIDLDMLELIENQKEKKQVLVSYIKARNQKMNNFLFGVIENQDDLLDLMKLQAESRYDVEEEWVSLLKTQEKRLEYLQHCIKVDAIVGKTSLSYVEKDDDKVKLANAFLDETKKQVEGDAFLPMHIRNEIKRRIIIHVESIENQEKRIQVMKKAIDNTLVDVNFYQGMIKSESDIQDILQYYALNRLKGKDKENYILMHNNMFAFLDKINEMIDKSKSPERIELLNNEKNKVLKILNSVERDFLRNGYINRYNIERFKDYQKVMVWKEKGRLPDSLIFNKIPIEKIEEFDFKIWNNLVKSVNKDLKDEEKGALVEIAYVFGLFDKDLKVARGIAKTDEEMTEEERLQTSAWENYEARKSNVIEFINSLESTDMLHEIFDGMGMEFNPKFYHFFMINKEDIINNIELLENQSQLNGISMGKIQSELKHIYRYIDKIEESYRTGTPTIKQCTNYLIQLRKNIANSKYENIQEGNTELARLCALSGCSQKKFEQYQDLFNKSKAREYSSIPRIKADKKIEIIEEDENKKLTVEKNKTGNDQLKIEVGDKKISFEILRMDNPRATVCGEKIFSDCCQSIGGQGESCLKHSQESRNGGILEIKTEDGTFLGQSWCWVNGNVLCFDSAELKGLDQNKNMSNKEKEEYLSMIKIGYEQMAKRMLEESSKKIEEYIKEQKAKAVLEYGQDSYEYKKREEEIEKIADNIRIKQVTIGQGFWNISKKLSEMYEVDKKKIEGTRQQGDLASPIEEIDYLNDSDVQYELARAEGIEDKDIKHNMLEENQEHIFTDKRNIIRSKGNIHREIIAKIKQIEQKSHKKGMQIMQDIDSVYGIDCETNLAENYGVNSEDIRVICGEDWYYVYSENENNIVIHDAARAPEARIEGEENISQAEIVEAFYEIMEEAANAGKPIKAQLREDTSYALYLKMLEKGQLEQIGEERIYDFKTGDKVEYTDEQLQMLQDMLSKKENRENLAKKEDTTMHEIECIVTQKGKAMIKRMNDRSERD